MAKETYERKPLSQTWYDMVRRCTNPKRPDWKNYGGRGIRCFWNSYDSFTADMLPSYKKGLTLDRIDVNGHYEKNNCRWISKAEQSRNRRNNLRIKGKLLSEWSKLLGIERSTLAQRYYVYGWSVDKVLSK